MANKTGNIWTDMLIDQTTSANNKFANEKSIVIFGDDAGGKASLSRKLTDDSSDESGTIHHGSGLDYYHMSVTDEQDDTDESGQCHIWLVDGNLSHRNLIRHCLPKRMIGNAMILLVVDMSKPWGMFESLEKWVKVIHEHLDSLKVSPEEMREHREKMLADWQAYQDPSEKDFEMKIVGDVATLGENVLVDNLGLPVMVVCTKSDQMENMETEYKEEHFDYIQHQLRQFCMKIGAGLCYTSMKDDKNVQLLRKYIVHKLYGFQFEQQASVVERENVFVPLGWDSDKKTKVLSETTNIAYDDASFDSVIVRPSFTRKLAQDMKEVLVDDEQMFLLKAQKLLQNIKPNKASYQPSSHMAAGDNPMYGKRPDLPNASMMAKSKVDGTKAGGNNERMLANFFNSLLMKKGPQGASTGGSPVQNKTAGGQAD